MNGVEEVKREGKHRPEKNPGDFDPQGAIGIGARQNGIGRDSREENHRRDLALVGVESKPKSLEEIFHTQIVSGLFSGL